MPFLQHNVMTCCSQVILVKVLMFLISLCCCFLRHGGDCQRLSEGQGKKRGNLNPRLVFLPFLAALAALGLPWLMTESLIVMDSKHSGLPDQTETLQNWLGSFQSDPSRTNWWGLTKFHNFGQISQFRPNFTILEYLELGQFRNFCNVLVFPSVYLSCGDVLLDTVTVSLFAFSLVARRTTTNNNSTSTTTTKWVFIFKWALKHLFICPLFVPHR